MYSDCKTKHTHKSFSLTQLRGENAQAEQAPCQRLCITVHYEDKLKVVLLIFISLSLSVSYVRVHVTDLGTGSSLPQKTQCPWNASSVVAPLILWLCDITLHHYVKVSYEPENELCPSLLLVLLCSTGKYAFLSFIISWLHFGTKRSLLHLDGSPLNTGSVMCWSFHCSHQQPSFTWKLCQRCESHTLTTCESDGLFKAVVPNLGVTRSLRDQ